MNMTLFKREIMKVLIDDEECIQKLIDLRNKKELERWTYQEEIKRLKIEEAELNELIVYLRDETNKLKGDEAKEVE